MSPGRRRRGSGVGRKGGRRVGQAGPGEGILSGGQNTAVGRGEPPKIEEAMDTQPIERKVAVGARMATLAAVGASSIGALLMIVLGLEETFWAVQTQITRGGGAPFPPATPRRSI